MVSPQKEKPRSEATQELEKPAEHRQAVEHPYPPGPGQPSSWILLLPGRFLLSSFFFLLRALLLHTAEKESAERVASLGPSQGVTGDGAGTGTRLGKTADPRGDDRAGLGSCFGTWLVGLNLACSLSPSPVSAGRRSHPFLQVRLPTCWWSSSPAPHLLHPTPPAPSAVHHRGRLASRPGQSPLWLYPASATQASFPSNSRKALAASTRGQTHPRSPQAALRRGVAPASSGPGEGQL